jgi:5-methylcytosine-specific restriction endonuclease McrA
MARTSRKSDTTGDALLSRPGRLIAGMLVGWTCPVCQRRMNSGASKRTGLQMDHLHPCSQGGGAVGNLIPLCGSCNASKRDATDLVGWLTTRLASVAGAKTTRGSKVLAPIVADQLTTLRDRLTATLTAEGIWS